MDYEVTLRSDDTDMHVGEAEENRGLFLGMDFGIHRNYYIPIKKRRGATVTLLKRLYIIKY